MDLETAQKALPTVQSYFGMAAPWLLMALGVAAYLLKLPTELASGAFMSGLAILKAHAQ